MHWNLLILIFVISVIYSLVAMINYATSKDEDQSMANFIFFYNPFRVIEYVQLTKEEKGKIGGWFWVHLASLSGLAISVIGEIISA